MLNFDLDVKENQGTGFFCLHHDEELVFGMCFWFLFYNLCTNKVATICNSVGNDSDNFCFLSLNV
jgi:hypothetical protein